MKAAVNFHVTNETTFGELRALFPAKIAGPKPTYKALRENPDVSVIASKTSIGGKIDVFSSGYAFYACEAGDVVLSLSECETYSYAADDEDLYKDEQGSGIYLYKKEVAKMPWSVPIAMTGELRASRNSFNRKGDRNRYESFGEDEEGNELDQWEMIADRNAVNPLQKVIEDEAYEERVSVLTAKQKDIVERYSDGYTQPEIAKGLNTSRPNVTKIIKAAAKNVKKTY